MNNKYHMPFNPRALWHWAYFNNTNSVMSSAIEVAKEGIQKKPSGMAGGWKTTKAGKTDFGGFSDASAKIWFEQQRQSVRAVIEHLPRHQKALGNVLYMPAGDIAEKNLFAVLEYLNRVCKGQLDKQFPIKGKSKKEYLEPLVYCALSHYWNAISPALDGSAIGSMNADYKFVHEIMDKFNKPIITRRWQGEWKGVWDMIINEIRKVDNEALKPLDAHIEQKIEGWSGYKKTEQLLKSGSK